MMEESIFVSGKKTPRCYEALSCVRLGGIKGFPRIGWRVNIPGQYAPLTLKLRQGRCIVALVP